MRVARIVSACVVLATLAGGCDSLDRRYFREGIGSELYTPDLPEVTQLQEMYIGFICRQAGLPVGETQQAIPSCGVGPSDGAGWTTFVQAGINDIDQRCDAYLIWLDARKRFSTAAQQQISDTRTATEAILAFTGVGPTPIAIVGSAFGFASATFTNLNSRLLLEVNHSTVQSLVLRRQADYREGLKGQLIRNRPDALYALRSYLRLCMPMTIETEINTTVTSVARNNEIPDQMISPATVSSVIIADPRRPVPDFRPTNTAEWQKRHDVLLEAALCVPATKKSLSDAIKDYLLGANRPQSADRKTALFVDQSISKVGDCKLKNYLTAFEVGRYGVVSIDQRKKSMGQLRQSLSDLLGKPLLETDDLLQLRDTIKATRAQVGLKPGNGEIDTALLNKLVE